MSNYQRLTSTGQVKIGGGKLQGFIVASGTPTIKLWDSADASGDIVLNTMQTAAALFYPLPISFSNGLFATITGAADVTFVIGDRTN